jgi:transcriptional regulator with XRE-family HTH domain
VAKSVFTKKYDQFRQLLIQARKAAGMTQLELAAKLSRPQSFVSKFERGERRLDVIEFLDIARALGFDPAHFLKKISKSKVASSPKSLL